MPLSQELSEEDRQHIEASINALGLAIRRINSGKGIANPGPLAQNVAEMISPYSPYVSNLLLGTISKILTDKGDNRARQVDEHISYKDGFADFTREHPDDSSILLENLFNLSGNQQAVFDVLKKHPPFSYKSADNIGGKKKKRRKTRKHRKPKKSRRQRRKSRKNTRKK